jgi:hypothetical protein
MEEHRAQVAQVEEEESLVVAVAEADRERRLLRLVEPHRAREEERTERGDRGTHGDAARSGQAQELDRARGRSHRDADRLRPLHHLGIGRAGSGEAAQIALHVREEDRNAGLRELLREDLERLRLPRSGRTRDETVTIQHRERHADARGRGHGSVAKRRPEEKRRLLE